MTIGQKEIVIGTLQAVIGRTVPALELFRPVSGSQLPHRAATTRSATGELVGELRRFSVSPLLEVVPPTSDEPLKEMLRDYRSRIYKGLYAYSLELFRTLRVPFLYGIATPEIYRFFTRSSMSMRRLDDMVLAETAEVRALQHSFAHYWRLDAPQEQQPALYQILVPA